MRDEIATVFLYAATICSTAGSALGLLYPVRSLFCPALLLLGIGLANVIVATAVQRQ